MGLTINGNLVVEVKPTKQISTPETESSSTGQETTPIVDVVSDSTNKSE